MIDILISKVTIEENKKTGENNPPIIVRQDGVNRYAHDVFIPGQCWITHRPASPHETGAVVWLMTDSPVEIVR